MSANGPPRPSRRALLTAATAAGACLSGTQVVGAPAARGPIVKIKRVNGVQKIQIGDRVYEPLAFRSFRPEKRNITEFHGAGVRLMSILSTGQDCTLDVPYSTFGEMWIGPGRYDFSKLDRQMELFLENAPDTFFNVMLQLDTKDWYRKLRPEASNSFYNLVEMAGDQQWRQDTALFLHDALRYIEGKYGDRVFAYSLFCGSSTEWYTNSQGNGKPEAEIRHHPLKEQAFRRFLRNHAAKLPGTTELFHTSQGVFRDPVKDRRALDYWRFHNEIIGDAILYFAARAQEVLRHRKLLGLFYGYLHTLGGTRLLHEGHLGFEKVWRSRDIDMIFAPARYGHPRSFAGASGYLSSVDSLPLHEKLTFHEIDHTTYVAPTHVENGRAIPGGSEKLRNERETVMVLRREFALTRVKRTGLWWFDFFGGYYYAPGLMREVANLVRVGHRLRDVPLRSVAQVAVFGDSPSMFHVSALARLSDDLLVQPPDALARLGAPFDLYTLSDLDHPRLPLAQYRLVIFLNALSVPAEKRTFIEKKVKAPGRTILWIYAPGYLQPKGFSVAAMSDLTGVALQPRDGVDPTVKVKNEELFGRLRPDVSFGFRGQVFPQFRIADPDARILGTYAADGSAALGYKRLGSSTAFYCAVGNIPAAVYREIARSAGVHLFTEGNDPVYVNNRLVGIHLQADREPTLVLPPGVKGRLLELFDGGELRIEAGRCAVPPDAGAMKLFLLADGEIPVGAPRH